METIERYADYTSTTDLKPVAAARLNGGSAAADLRPLATNLGG